MRLFFALVLLCSSSAFARTVNVSFECAAKAYSCGPTGCDWTVFNAQRTTVSMADKGDGFATARYVTNYDGHVLTLDFTYDEQSGKNPLSVKAYLGTTTVMAETSGTRTIDISLRNNSYGRGFYCSDIRSK